MPPSPREQISRQLLKAFSGVRLDETSGKLVPKQRLAEDLSVLNLEAQPVSFA